MSNNIKHWGIRFGSWSDKRAKGHTWPGGFVFNIKRGTTTKHEHRGPSGRNKTRFYFPLSAIKRKGNS